MRHIIFALFAAMSALALPGCASTTGGALIERNEVMDVSRRIAADYASTWNASDMNRFGALYAPEARHVTLAGAFLRGRAAIVSTHRDNRTRYAENIRMVTRLEGARAITNDAIVAVMLVEFVNDPSQPNGIQTVRLTLTLTRQGRDWLISQAHASAAT